MIAESQTARPSGSTAWWLRVGAMLLAVAAVGLPINELFGYALLVAAAIAIFSGTISARPEVWLAAIVAVTAGIAVRLAVAPPPIEEGHNVFLADGAKRPLERFLPADVHAVLQAAFDARYPPERRCDAAVPGCWRGDGFPDRAFAFSADGAIDRPAHSRRVGGIDFSDPVWLRLGVINERFYNWYGTNDLERATRDRRFFMGFRRWHLTMPWYVMYRFPTALTGSALCWRGTVLWENEQGRFDPIRHADMACRNLAPTDAGRRIFGVAIEPGSLAMRLKPTTEIRLRQFAGTATALVSVAALLLLLVRLRPRDAITPSVLLALALVVIAVDDLSFVGGLRPFDGGDDGLFYTGVGRQILESLLDGDLRAALIGGEPVFYYGGPGLRYLRALEMLLFGDTNLGYLSLILILPVIVYALMRRFLPASWVWPMALIFVAVPIGEVFGSSFFHYAKWAARGFADPAAHIFFLCGLLVIAGATREGPSPRFAAALGGGLLMALAVFVKPIVSPMVAVILGGAGLAALAQRQWSRLAGLCLGFAPFLVMPLHNWYFGQALVLFSTNMYLPEAQPMPPSAYWAALGELVRLDLHGEHLVRALRHNATWLSGPSELVPLVPLHLAAVAIVVHVAACGRGFDPWLRLLAVAAIAQYAAAMIFLSAPRYHYAMWLITGLVVGAFVHAVGLPWLRRRPVLRLQRPANRDA